LSQAPYIVAFTPAAARQWRRLTKQVQAQLQPVIDALATQPRPSGVVKLEGGENYRVRSGSFRVVFTIEDRELLVTIVGVGNRKDVYR
jgi:mRNA interferase RelE/StbE